MFVSRYSLALQCLEIGLLLVTTTLCHEIRVEFRKLLQDSDQGAACRSNAQLVADALNLQVDVRTLISEFSGNAYGLRISVAKSFHDAHFRLPMYMWTDALLGKILNALESGDWYVQDSVEFRDFEDNLIRRARTIQFRLSDGLCC